MAEITYQMILSTLQTVALIVGISYYIIVLRNQQKSQKHAEETRKIQLIHELNEFFMKGHANIHFNEMMKMEWKDYNDYKIKYGLEKNPELYDETRIIWRNMNYNGLLIKHGMIDASVHVHIIGDDAPKVWSKFKDIIEEMRIENDNPELYIGMEILAREVDNYGKVKV